MKKLILALVVSVSIIGSNFAEEDPRNGAVNLYTFFVNIVSEQFKFPLLGFVNIAGGDHAAPQFGFINWNQGNFKSVQMSFVNTAGGDMIGLQSGFINTILGTMSGVQMGFVNTIAGETAKGLQLGFVNTAAHNFSGSQTAFINIAKQVKGLQLGFINYAESIGEGMPIGFLSIVRNGGYRAVELGVSEISPINVSFKIGVEKLYTSFSVAYNPFREGIREQIICGAGFGSIIRMGKVFFFNPEIMAQNSIGGTFQNYLSFVPHIGYDFAPNFSILLGPSITWTYASNKEMQEPFISILKQDINTRHALFFGGKIALRLHW